MTAMPTIVLRSELKPRKQRTGAGESKYAKYERAIAPFLPWIKENIAASADGSILLKANEVAEQMDANSNSTEFSEKAAITVYWATKLVVFKYDLVVEPKKMVDGTPLFEFKFKTPDDKLPPSLVKQMAKYEASVPVLEL